MDSLQHLVDEFHVDGFCFVNAACLVTGPHGQELSRPMLVEAITFDPVLASTKLIADSCSPFNGVWKVTNSTLFWEFHSPVHLFESLSRCSKAIDSLQFHASRLNWVIIKVPQRGTKHGIWCPFEGLLSRNMGETPQTPFNPKNIRELFGSK